MDIEEIVIYILGDIEFLPPQAETQRQHKETSGRRRERANPIERLQLIRILATINIPVYGDLKGKSLGDSVS